MAFRQQVSTLSLLEEERSRIVHCPRYPPCHDTFNHVSNRGPIATFFQVPCPAASHSLVPLPAPAPVESYQIRRIEVAGRWSCPIHAPNSPRRKIQLWPQPCNYLPPAMCSDVTAARSDTPMVSLSPSVVLLLPFFSLCAFHLTAFAPSSFICTPILTFCRPFCHHPSPPT